MPYKKITQLDEKQEIIETDKILILDTSDILESDSGKLKQIKLQNIFQQDINKIETNSIAFTTLQVTDDLPSELSQVTLSSTGQFQYSKFIERDNDIGIPGTYGFGCGVCPESDLPENFLRIPGYNSKVSSNYGNYIHTPSSSVIVWIPKFYYRINHESNPTHSQYAPNDIDIKSIYDFEDTASANAEGYALHRAFIDGGVEQPGFFIDKYSCSKVAYGTGYIGASIKNGVPIGFDEAFSCITELTASNSVRQAYIVIDCAKARDGVDGQVNPTSNWHCASTFQYSALALLSLAHGQASTNTSTCAWYDPVYNYPKGNNNNTLGDIDDPTVKYRHDGYPTRNTALTGSGVPFAKTTHNGQECGIADLNGNVETYTLGMSSIGSTKTITDYSLSNPCVLTLPNVTNLEENQFVYIYGTALPFTSKNFKILEIIDSTHISIELDSTLLAPFTSSGTLHYADWNVAKESTSMKTFTSGITLATDHWGSTGISNLMDVIVFPMLSNVNYAGQYFGSSLNQVFSSAVSGEEYIKTCSGIPMSINSISNVGTNLFGKDLCGLANLNAHWCVRGGIYNSVSNAGINSIRLYTRVNNTLGYPSYRCAYYL